MIELVYCSSGVKYSLCSWILYHHEYTYSIIFSHI